MVNVMPNHPSLPIRLPSQLEDRGQASQYDYDVVQLFPVWRLSYLVPVCVDQQQRHTV